MSLDKFTKPEKKQDGTKGPEKVAAKPDAAKKQLPQKAVKKAPTKSKSKLAKVEAEEDADEEAGESEGLRSRAKTDSDAEGAGIEAPAPHGSALEAMGLEKYALACPACKYKKELRISGEPKPHQLLCKKCGGQMKASKKA